MLEFQASQPPEPETAALHRLARRRRFWIAGLVFLGAAAGVWFFGGSLNREAYPAWFIPLLQVLIAVNLLFWALEPVGDLPLPAYGGCGEPRLSGDTQQCPLCGSIVLKQSRLGQAAIWTAGLAFLAVGVFMLLAGREPSKERAKALSVGTGYCLLAVVVLLRAGGVRIEKYLHSPYLPILDVEVENDFQRISYNRYVGRRVLLLLISVGVFVLATTRLLR